MAQESRVRNRRASVVTHVCFHGIGSGDAATDDDERDYWISETFFLQVLDELVGRDDVRISFDDGFASDVSVALPALLERGLHATFFPVMERIGRPGSVSDEDLLALRDAGMGLGVHGWTHDLWTGYSPSDLAVDLERCRTLLHGLTGQVVDQAACPLGMYDRRVLRVLRQQGFRQVFTSDRSPAVEGAWLQPRYSTRAFDSIADVRQILDGAAPVWRGPVDRLRLLGKRLR